MNIKESNMKRFIYGLVSVAMLCCISLASYAQNHDEMKEDMMKQPRTVMKEARMALDEARRKGDSPRLIDALMRLSAAQLLVDTDSMQAVTQEIKQCMRSSDNPVERSVIAIYLCDLYRYWCDQNYRSHYNTYIPDNDNMATWNTRNYNDAIDSLVAVALAPATELQKTPIARYRSIIDIEGYDGREAWKWTKKFYPTMYDFVIEQILNYNDSSQHYIDDALTFHNRTGAPHFMWQLKKIKASYDMNVKQTQQQACEALDALIKQYIKQEYVIEAVIERLSIALSQADDAPRRRSVYNEAQTWIKRYPRYYRTGCLQQMCAELSFVQLNATTPLVAYPDIPVTVDITYSNTSEVQYTLLRCNNIYLGKDGKTDIQWGKPMRDLSRVEEWQDVTLLCDSALILNAGDPLTFEERKSSLVLPPLSRGIYLLKIKSGSNTVSLPFAVATHLLYGLEVTEREIIAVLTDNRTGQPTAGEEVILLSSQGDTVQRAVTDSNGVCRFTNDNASRSYWLMLKNNDLYPFSVRTDFNTETYRPEQIALQIFTDRSIYRPGQELQFSALVYLYDGEEHSLLPHQEVVVTLRDAGYNELWCETFTTDEYGSLHGAVELPKNALAGDWRLTVECGETRRSSTIVVSEYKRPQFGVECNPIEGTYTYGDTIHITGEAKSYSAVPIAHAEVKYTVKSSSWYGYGSEVIHSGTLRTDAEGRFAFDFLATEPANNQWRMWGTRYMVDVTVTSSTGETQSNMTMLSISGTSVRFNIGLPSIVCREEIAPFDIVMVNGEGTPQQLPMQVTLYTLMSDVIGESLDRMNVSEQPLWSHYFAAGESRVELPLWLMTSGAYRLMVVTHDHSGTMVEDSTDFILYSQLDTQPPVPTAMWVPVGNTTIDAGTSARLQVGTSFTDASLLYIVKANNEIVDLQRIALDNSVATIDVPYRTTYTDAVKIELLLVRDKTIYNKQVIVRCTQPDLSLTITPTTFRDKTQPGAPEKWQFTVRDPEGNPVNALFMTAMYDASLDALRAHAWHFNPQYYPRIPYIGLSQFWEYNRSQNDYLGYYTEYENVSVYSTLTPMLYTYLDNTSRGLGVVYQTAPLLRSASVKMANHVANGVCTEAMYDELSVDTSIEAEEAATTDAPHTSDANKNIPIEYRTNLNETAFFYPHLVTDKSGNVVVEFTMPQSNTTWNFLSLAVTPALQHATYNATVISNKPLMVSPNMPRFVRQGDKIILAVAVQNMTEKALRGTAELTLYNPENEAVIATFKQPVSIQTKGSTTAYFEIEIPQNISLIGVRVGASTSLYSDGEQHIVAVLPATQLVTEAQPFYLSPSTSDTTVVFTAMEQNMQRKSVENYRVTLEYCDNPAWYAVTALPSLSQPTDESATAWMASLYANTVARGIIRQNSDIATAISAWKKASTQDVLTSQLMKNEELKQIILSQTPWLLDAQNSTGQMQQIASFLDSVRATELHHEAVLQLSELQSNAGGWAWFKSMYPSYWLTLNILNGLSRLSVWGETPDDEMIARMAMKALQYVDAEYEKMNKDAEPNTSYLDLCYLYVRSAYTDVPMSQEILSIHRKQIDYLVEEWYRLDEVEKAYAAIALYRYGYNSVAIEIVNSLREYATITPQQGMFWGNNRSTAYYRNSAIQVHCAIYEALELIDYNRNELDLMRQWLLMQKQTQSWGNVPSTLDAANILLASGTNWLNKGMNSQVNWGGKSMPQTTQAEQVMGYEKWTREGKNIDKRDAQVTIGGHQDQPSWGAIYWQYFDNISQVTEQGSKEITLQRSYYVMRDGVWVSAHSTSLQVGDEVLVRLQFYTDRDMQFMVLNDPRPACFEPQQQLPRYISASDIWYYAVPSDAANTFYFDHLSRGTHVVEYRVNVDRAGLYQAGVASLQSFYAPQYTAHSDGVTVDTSL